MPIFPTINASLNGLAGVFLILGYISIKRGKPNWHRGFMRAALISSGLFLSCYLYYHFTTHLITHYMGQGILRPIYFTILLTHTPLAVAIVPFIVAAVYYAIKGQFDRHKRITKWLFPVWLYVSVTGVMIYLMLYVF